MPAKIFYCWSSARLPPATASYSWLPLATAGYRRLTPVAQPMESCKKSSKVKQLPAAAGGRQAVAGDPCCIFARVAKIVVCPKFWPRKICNIANHENTLATRGQNNNEFWPSISFGHYFGRVWGKSICILATIQFWPPISFGNMVLYGAGQT